MDRKLCIDVFEGILGDLKASGYRGPVTLEVTYRGDYPMHYTPEAYIKKCHEIASQIAEKIS